MDAATLGVNANKKILGGSADPFVVVVPSYNTIEDAEDKLPEFIGFGVCSAPALKALHVFTSKVRVFG